MQDKIWQLSNSLQRQIYAASTTESEARMQRWLGRLCFAGTLLALVGLLSGCHPQLIQPCEMPKLPTPPALSEPMPSVSYSTSAQADIQAWQKRLIASPATGKP